MYRIFLLFFIVTISAENDSIPVFKLKWPPKNKWSIDISVVEGSDIDLDCNRYGIDYIEGCPHIKWTRFETEFSSGFSLRSRTPIMNAITNKNKYPYLCVEGSRLCKIDTYLDVCTKPVLNLRNLTMNDTNQYQCKVLTPFQPNKPSFQTYDFNVVVYQEVTETPLVSEETENTDDNVDTTSDSVEVNGVLNNIGKDKKYTTESQISNDNSVTPDKNTDSDINTPSSRLMNNSNALDSSTNGSEVVPGDANNSDNEKSNSPVSNINQTRKEPEMSHSNQGKLGALKSEQTNVKKYWWIIFPILLCAILFVGLLIKRQNTKNVQNIMDDRKDTEYGEKIPFSGDSLNGEDMEFKPSLVKPMGTHGLIANDRKVTIVPPPHHKSISPIIAGRPSVVPPKRRSTMKPVDPRRPSSVGSMFNEGDSYDESTESIREALSNIIMSKKSYAELFTRG